MWARTVGVAALAVLVGGLPVSAAAHRITGVVTGVSDRSLQVTTANKEVHVVAIDAETTYAKWITHQPWQQSARLDGRALTAGRCVQVEERSENGHVANVVRINLDTASTIWDPCTSLR
ncbi:MAG TPA: hypothetical protein VLV86_19135 [Vicinamibacterales bacterium]|nr:hypothetical protein [Vicinamibacterales bacterium]